MSPIMSYADQIYSIHRTKTSAGFSMDIPLIMLVASIFKCVRVPLRGLVAGQLANGALLKGVLLVRLILFTSAAAASDKHDWGSDNPAEGCPG